MKNCQKMSTREVDGKLKASIIDMIVFIMGIMDELESK